MPRRAAWVGRAPTSIERYSSRPRGPGTHCRTTLGKGRESLERDSAGGGRTGYWFAPERKGGKDGERVALNPSGFSVSTVLQTVGAYALLAVPR